MTTTASTGCGASRACSCSCCCSSFLCCLGETACWSSWLTAQNPSTPRLNPTSLPVRVPRTIRSSSLLLDRCSLARWNLRWKKSPSRTWATSRSTWLTSTTRTTTVASRCTSRPSAWKAPASWLLVRTEKWSSTSSSTTENSPPTRVAPTRAVSSWARPASTSCGKSPSWPTSTRRSRKRRRPWTASRSERRPLTSSASVRRPRRTPTTCKPSRASDPTAKRNSTRWASSPTPNWPTSTARRRTRSTTPLSTTRAASAETNGSSRLATSSVPRPRPTKRP